MKCFTCYMIWIFGVIWRFSVGKIKFVMKIYFFITFLKVKDFKIKMSNRCPVITRRAGPGPDALGCGIGVVVFRLFLGALCGKQSWFRSMSAMSFPRTWVLRSGLTLPFTFPLLSWVIIFLVRAWSPLLQLFEVPRWHTWLRLYSWASACQARCLSAIGRASLFLHSSTYLYFSTTASKMLFFQFWEVFGRFYNFVVLHFPLHFPWPFTFRVPPQPGKATVQPAGQR